MHKILWHVDIPFHSGSGEQVVGHEVVLNRRFQIRHTANTHSPLSEETDSHDLNKPPYKGYRHSSTATAVSVHTSYCVFQAPPLTETGGPGIRYRYQPGPPPVLFPFLPNKVPPKRHCLFRPRKHKSVRLTRLERFKHP